MKPLLPAQGGAGLTTAVQGASTVNVSNVGATAGGKVLITQAQQGQQTGKVGRFYRFGCLLN